MAIYLNPFDHSEAWDSVVLKGVRTPGKAEVGAWARENEYDTKKGKGTKGATNTLKSQPPAKGPIVFTAWTREHFAAWDRIDPLLTYVPHATGSAASSTASPTSPTSPTGAQAITGTQSGTATASPSTLPDSGTSGKDKDDDTASTTSQSAGTALSKDDAIDIFHPALAGINVHSVLPPEKLGSWVHKGKGEYERTIEFIEFDPSGDTNIATTPTGSSDAASAADGQTSTGTPTTTASAAGNTSTSGTASDAQGVFSRAP